MVIWGPSLNHVYFFYLIMYSLANKLSCEVSFADSAYTSQDPQTMGFSLNYTAKALKRVP